MMLELEGREKTATNAAVAQERNQWNLGKNKTEIFPFFPFISIVFNASSPIPALFHMHIAIADSFSFHSTAAL